MSVQDSGEGISNGHGEIRDKAALQAAITDAFAFLNAGQPREAIALLARYAGLAASSDIACYVFGLIFFNADDLRSALSWFDRALALKPADPEALGARAIVLQRLGQPQDALEAFEALLKLRPDDADTFFSIGVILQSLGRMRDSLAAYEDALRRRPDHCEALTNRGALLERFGRFEEALACFEAIVARRPGDGGALFNKGSVLQKLGRNQDALAAYEEAALSGPVDAETELNRGNVLQKLGRIEEALCCYDRSSRCRDGYPQALYNKGIALHALGRPIEALQTYDAALALDPRYCEAACNRGNVLHELGRLDEAFAAYADALKIRPGFVPALTNRANIFLQWGRADQALRCCEEALRHDARHPQALGLRGAALQKLGRLDEALTSLDRAVEMNRLAPEVWLNRGNVLQETDRLPEAIASYNEALRVRPNYPEALSSLGVALKESGQVDQALVCFNEALRHKPAYADARNNRAGALLLKGMLHEGFEDFESRWERSNAPPKTVVAAAATWRGEDLRGRSILVWDEQGLGDLIQFCRYLPPLVEAGAEVTLLCRKNMQRLLRTLPVPVRFVEARGGAETYDFESPLLSLPRGFRTTLETIPARTPYLCPEPAVAAKWAARIGADGFRIGVCWRGNAAINLKRSVPPSSFGAVAAIDGVRLIGLVKDQPAIDIGTPKGSFSIESLGLEFDAGPDSFVDCAAAMADLDLVITSDTAIAHLAGALGRPVFVALKHAPDWRWLLARSDSPWYPTMRLFRQRARDEWGPVFDDIAAEVEVRARARCPARRAAAGPPALAGGGALIAIPGAIGEMIDRITILEIKERRVDDVSKLRNIRFELDLLRKLKAEARLCGDRLDRMEAELKRANEILWNVEDALRACEARRQFDDEFISFARLVYTSNDRRAALKKKINLLFNSAIVEEKSYASAS
jgi:tetratricopeptide (TPR) repeat protein